MPFRFSRLEIPEVIQIERVSLADRRGSFAEAFRESEFRARGISGPFVQDNHSRSVRGVLRGLHYQRPPRAQGKLIMVMRGEVFDVAVDIRHGSPTFGRWVSSVLSEENGRMLYVPEGFAHGFSVISDEADVLYKVTAEYTPDLDTGILWNDPDVGVRWPISTPILSDKDAVLPRLREAPHDFAYTGQA